MTRIMALVLGCVLWAGQAFALEPFIISDIRVEGLQRISEGTVFNYLPIDPGDRMTASSARAAIRELYKTGFFQDISLAHEGTILVINVRERPAIANITLDGNKAIKDEDLYRVLFDVGLSEGEVYDRQVLDRLQQEMVRQYFSQGRYAVTVDTRVTELERNRVRIAIIIDEGKVAQIRHINIVGNTVFTDDEITEGFEAGIPPFWNFWSSKDQYSREKLSGDIEILRSYYLDRGYVDFNVESTQVSISPDKKDIFITANIVEGDVYSVEDVQITGDLVIDEGTLQRLIVAQPGEIFSRRNIEQSVENITAVLSNIGYAFANVNPITDVDRDNRLVSVNFFVDPGKRVYVRRIQFVGNAKSKDEVLRREMRQFEGAWFSQAAIDRSRVRMQRLAYFESVEIETPAVPGTDDQIDVIVTVVERAAGSFTVGLGYSQVQQLIASLSVQQDNFLGSGKRLGFGVSHSRILSSINLSYDNPYWTEDGVSRGFYARYQEFDQQAANISAFTSSEWAVGGTLGIPVTEIDYLRTNLGYRDSTINLGRLDCIEFDDPEDPTECLETVLRPAQLDPLSHTLDFNGDDILSKDEREFNTFDWSVSWTRDSRNHFLNPTRGSSQSLTLQTSLPGSSREYYKLLYRGIKYIEIWRGLVFAAKANLGYGDAYDSYDRDSMAEAVPTDPVPGQEGRCDPTDIVGIDRGLPFYEHFYSGGVRDLRGYDDNTLGPKDPFCRSVGGDFKVTGGIELALPLQLGGQSGTRVALFVDSGYVYENIDAFDADKLRGSAGISVTWEAPIGPIVISYAFPFNDREGDRTEDLQFSFGTTF